MPLPQTKAELAEALREAYYERDSEFESFPPEHERTPGIKGETRA